jgi:hypothetical protein
MNSLSWLLYAADASDGLKTAGVVVCGLSLTFAAFVGGIAALNKFDGTFGGGERVAGPLFKFTRALTVIGSIAGLLSIAAPSRSTLMLIAASEVGETVLASEQAQQIGGEAGALATDSIRVLRKFINDQLAEGEK